MIRLPNGKIKGDMSEIGSWARRHRPHNIRTATAVYASSCQHLWGVQQPHRGAK